MPLMRFWHLLLDILCDCSHHVNLKKKKSKDIVFWGEGMGDVYVSDRVPLYSSGYPQTQKPPSSACWLLGL